MSKIAFALPHLYSVMKKRKVVLIADDNPDDRLLLKTAWEETASNSLYFVEDGEELMNFLFHQGKYGDPGTAIQPDLILLDFKMPRKNGYEVLQDLKNNPDFRKIPIVVMTTSKSESDILRSYNLGANSYFTKPDTFEEILALMQTINSYWFESATLPDYRK